MKYSPYQGFCSSPWLFYGELGYPERVKTQHDYSYRILPRPHYTWHEWFHGQPRQESLCRRCGKTHCDICGCFQPWKKYHKTAMRRYLKCFLHRQFRRQCQRLIQRELAGDDAVCHNIIVSGDWLD